MSSFYAIRRPDPPVNRLKGLVNSQCVLLALTQAGLSREDSYKAVQRNAMQVAKNLGRSAPHSRREDPECLLAV